MSDEVRELTLDETWTMLSQLPEAVLIDVRTAAEWTFVGQPDLSSVGKQLRSVEWTTFPGGEHNPSFLAQATAGLAPDQPILLLCRSGARSRAAARALSEAGFARTHNITDGFEGDLDAGGQRQAGWKGAGLPWRQR